MDKSSDGRQDEPRRKSLLAGGLAHFIHDGFTDMLYIFFPIWQAQFSLTFAQVGLLKTLFSGTMAGFQMPAGLLAQSIGQVRLLLLGTFLTSCSVWFYGWSANPTILGCLLVIGGLGSSVQHPISSSIISNEYTQTDTRRNALSIFNVAGDIGKLILPGAAALLIAQYNWPFTCRTLGVVGMATGIIIFVIGRNIQPVKSSKGKNGRFPLCGFSLNKAQAFWALSMIGVIDSATRMGFLTFFPFLLQAKGAEVTTIGLALSLIFAGGITGKFFCGILATRLSVLRLVIITEVMTTLCILSMLVFPLKIAIILSPILGIALNGTSSVLYGSVPELVSEERCPQAFGIFYTATIGSGAISPSIYGLVSDVIGINFTVILIAVIVLFTVLLTLPLRGKLAHH